MNRIRVDVSVLSLAIILAISSPARAALLYVSVPNSGIFTVDTSNGSETQIVFGLINPRGLTFGSDGNLYVAENSTHEILRYSPSGQLLGAFPGPAGFINSLGSFVPFNYSGMTANSSGDLFLAISNDQEIYKLSLSAATEQVIAMTGNPVPYGLALDSSGNLFATDPGNDQLQKLTGPGYTTQSTYGLDRFASPRGIVVDAGNTVYVGETSFAQDEIHKYSTSGADLGFFNPARTGSSLVFDSADNMFALSAPSISEFDSSGNYVTTLPHDVPGAEFMTIAPTPVPEPSSLVLLIAGAVGVVGLRFGSRRRICS